MTFLLNGWYGIVLGTTYVNFNFLFLKKLSIKIPFFEYEIKYKVLLLLIFQRDIEEK